MQKWRTQVRCAQRRFDSLGRTDSISDAQKWRTDTCHFHTALVRSFASVASEAKLFLLAKQLYFGSRFFQELACNSLHRRQLQCLQPFRDKRVVEDLSPRRGRGFSSNKNIFLARPLAQSHLFPPNLNSVSSESGKFKLFCFPRFLLITTDQFNETEIIPSTSNWVYSGSSALEAGSASELQVLSPVWTGSGLHDCPARPAFALRARCVIMRQVRGAHN